MNNKRLFLVLIGSLLVLSVVFSFNVINDDSTNKLIACEENKKYVELQLNIERNKNKELQNVYNNLNTDFYNCYMANFCYNYPEDCVEYLEIDLSIQEIQDYYFRECDSASRDWEKYASYDTEITNEKLINNLNT
jgi:type VI protein secretion system component Hcp